MTRKCSVTYFREAGARELVLFPVVVLCHFENTVSVQPMNTRGIAESVANIKAL